MKRSVIEVKALSLRKEIYMANSTRDIPIQFFVTAEEKKMIRKKMILSRTAKRNFRIKRLLRNTVKFIVHVVIWFVPRKMLRTKHSIARSIRQSISYMMSL